MKWSLIDLKREAKDGLYIDEDVDLKTDLCLRDAEILDAKNARIQVFLVYEAGSVLVSGEVMCPIQLPSSRSLEPLWLELRCPVNERFVTGHVEIGDELATVTEIEGDVLDLRPMMIDLILLNKPISCLSEAEKAAIDEKQLASGTDWQLLTEAMLKKQVSSEATIDPRMAKLKVLLDDFKDTSSEEEK